jgi:hypothetical protein
MKKEATKNLGGMSVFEQQAIEEEGRGEREQRERGDNRQE